MRKRVIMAFAAAALTASAMAGCVPQATSETEAASTAAVAEGEELVINKEGLPIVNQPITYEIAANTQKNKNFKDLEYFQKLEESTNVIINWNMTPEVGWNEKKSLLFAGNTLPDAFYGQDILTDVDITKYGSQGMLIPLNDLIDEYAPNLKAILDENPQYRKQITAPDGNIYSLPSITELNPTTHDKLFINKSWLDTLGLEVPTTKEEFEAVLQAFKDGDPNGNGEADEIPFTFRMNSNDPYNRQNGLQSMFGTFGQLDDIYHFIVKDGKVIYTPQTEPYKEAISWFHDLYAQGLLDKEAFTHDLNVYFAKIQDPGKIVGAFLGWSRNATAAGNKDDFVVMAPLPDEDGNQVWRRVESKLVSKGAFAITSEAEHPEVLMRWIDQSYEPENSLQVNQGLFGHALEKTEDGGYRYKELEDGMTLDTVIHDYSPGNDGVCAVMKPTIEKLELNANLQERQELDEFYAPYNAPADEVYPNVLFTEEEVEEIGILQTDIDSYVIQKYATWIAEGGVEEEWDEFQKKLEDMNVERYKEIYQQAYDRYNAE